MVGIYQRVPSAEKEIINAREVSHVVAAPLLAAQNELIRATRHPKARLTPFVLWAMKEPPTHRTHHQSAQGGTGAGRDTCERGDEERVIGCAHVSAGFESVAFETCEDARMSDQTP